MGSFRSRYFCWWEDRNIGISVVSVANFPTADFQTFPLHHTFESGGLMNFWIWVGSLDYQEDIWVYMYVPYLYAYLYVNIEIIYPLSMKLFHCLDHTWNSVFVARFGTILIFTSFDEKGECVQVINFGSEYGYMGHFLSNEILYLPCVLGHPSPGNKLFPSDRA